MPPIEQILLGAALLLLVSIAASKASGRLGVPALVIFMIIGMLAGSEGPGKIYFDNFWQAQSIGVLALALILFAGGLDTQWKEVRPVLGHALVLSTLGVLVTAGLVGWFASTVLGVSLLEGLLLGAIVSSTDAAAVFSVMRSRSVSLKGNLKPLLELESGSNDPMAVFLTVGIIGLLSKPDSSLLELVPAFILQMSIGAVAGYLLGRLAIILINRINLEYEGLYPVLSMAYVLFAYAATTLIGGNGFLAVYIVGLVMANLPFIHKRSIARFHDGLAWLMQIAMFVALGLLVFPSQLLPVMGAGLLVSAFLMFVARPLSIFLLMHTTRLTFPEKAMVSWVGLRGSVPIILATFPLLAGIPKADVIFNLVFFIVMTSVILQGTSIPLVSKWLGVYKPLEEKVAYPLEFNPMGDLSSDLVEIAIPADSPAAGKPIVALGFPAGALIVMLRRQQDFIVPSGSTVLTAGDTMLMLAQKEDLPEVEHLVTPARLKEQQPS
jgi:cell volume regulation protein A